MCENTWKSRSMSVRSGLLSGDQKKRSSTAPVSVRVSINGPYDFSLYSTIFAMSDYAMPYAYTPFSWKSTIEGIESRPLPIEVIPDSPTNTKSLLVRIYGEPTTKEEKVVKETVKKVFCTDLSMGENNNFFKNGFEDIFSIFSGLKPHLSQDPFQALIKLVIRQLIGAEFAKKVITQITEKFGEVIHIGESLFFAFPTALTLSRAEKKDLLDCGVGYKWHVIQELSREVVDGDLDLTVLKSQDSERVTQELMERPGIGSWTSQVFLFDGLHRLDSYPIFDITIQRALEYLSKVTSFMETESGWTWDIFGPSYLIGFYATFLFAFFRQVVKHDRTKPNERTFHCV